ncbi:MAG: PAS domain S-box protein [Polyangiaceae bacterium]
MGEHQDHDIYRELLDAAPDAIIVIGSDEIIFFANRQAEKLFGYAREELLGKGLETLIPARFQRAHHGHIARFLAAPSVRPMGFGISLWGERKDGTEIPIEVSLSPVQHKNGQVAVAAAIRDVTERRRFEEALREARAAAEAASSAKSDFLSSVSHELRTPLNAILGFAELLQFDPIAPLDPRHRERAAHIVTGGEHLLRLIDDILDLSRIEAGNISISQEAVSVELVVAELETTLAETAQRASVNISFTPATQPIPMISVDRTRFVQILMNLASNAIKYNRKGGSVTIRTERAGDYVRITVADTGIGIPLDKQDKLFQPFQRAGQETGAIEGTGIGLVITRRLAELMGGKVDFRSVPGEGSTFWVDMPIHQLPVATDAAAPSSQAMRLSIPPGDTKHVLYVEDNPANVAFMRDVLGMFEAISLDVATSAEQAIEMAAAAPPDLILMDINLPGMSGIDALHALRHRPETARIPVIALTAAASERDRQRGREAGFYRYLTKPVRLHELVEVFEKTLSNRKAAKGEDKP